MKIRILTLVVSGLLTTTAWAQGDFEKGISFYKQGQYAKAIAEFEPIVKKEPEYEPGFRVLGDSYLKLKQYDKAAAAFQKAIALKPANFVSHRGAAVAEFNLKRFQDAVATLTRAEKYAESPGQRYFVFQLRGSANYSLDRFAMAISDLEKAVGIRRGAFQDVFQLGVAYYRTGDRQRARSYLEQAVAIQPAAKEAQEFLAAANYEEGLAAMRSQDYETATSLIEKYVASHPTDGEAFYNLGLAQLLLERLDAAEFSLLRSAQYLPSNWDTFNRLGFVYEKKGRFKDSLDNYQKALGLHQDPEIDASVKRIQERLRRQAEE